VDALPRCLVVAVAAMHIPKRASIDRLRTEGAGSIRGIARQYGLADRSVVTLSGSFGWMWLAPDVGTIRARAIHLASARIAAGHRQVIDLRAAPASGRRPVDQGASGIDDGTATGDPVVEQAFLYSVPGCSEVSSTGAVRRA